MATRWQSLPLGARAAFEEQWDALAAGGLPCGAAVVDADGQVIARGRNHVYDPAGSRASQTRYPLQATRLAHAEMNALAGVRTDADHETLTLWTTQHPCAMCTAAVAFVGIGSVRFIADDPSDDDSGEVIAVRRAGVRYEPLGDSFWQTASNLLFLYASAVRFGEQAGNIRQNRDRHPTLVSLTLQLAATDALGEAARAEQTLLDALDPYFAEISAIAGAGR
jgi:tRNA(Arg) A34 adenosine deaminase TadA